MKSPQQQIFDSLYALSLEQGNDTYDYLPPSEAKYPFVHIGEQFDNDTANKTNVSGELTQFIHVYNVHEKRMETTSILNNLKHAVREIRHTETFYISVRGVRQRLIVDSSTPTPLLKGMLEIDFKFN